MHSRKSKTKSKKKSNRSRSRVKIAIKYNRSRTTSRRNSSTRKSLNTRVVRSRPKKVKQISFRPLNGKKVYCGGLEELPSPEYERFGSRRECLDIGFGAGRNTEYNYLRSLLLQEGYEIPERKRYDY